MEKEIKLEGAEEGNNLKILKSIYDTLTKDPIRLEKEKIWRKSELQVAGYMKPRTDERGAKLSRFNINQSAKSVNYLTQTFFNLLHESDKIFQINPTGIDDILTARLITNTINGKCWQIEDFEITLLMSLYQNFTYGFTAGKFIPTPEWDLEYISPADIYVSNALSFAKVPAIVQKLTWGKEELEEQASNFDQKQLDEFMEKGKYEYEAPDIPYEQLSATNIKKKLKINYSGTEIWYKVDKNWRFAVLGSLDVVNDGNVIPIPTFLLSDKASTLWCGHPYCFAGGLPDLRSLYWTGEPELVRNLQEHLNMFVNLIIDYLADSVRPPLIWEAGFVDSSVSLDPLLNPGMGGEIQVTNLAGATWLPKPPLNPQVFNMLPILADITEQINGLYGITRGEPAAREEPATTTLRRQALATAPVNFRFNVFYTTFLKTLAQKMILGLFQYPPQEDFIAHGGANEEYIKIQKGNDLKAEKMPGQPYCILTLPANQTIAKKYTRDIQVANDIATKLNQIEQKNLLQYIQIIMQMMATAPEIRMGSNIAELLEDTLYQIGGNKTKKYFDAEKIQMAQIAQLAQGGLQAGKMGQSAVAEGGEGAVGAGAELKSVLRGGQ